MLAAAKARLERCRTLPSIPAVALELVLIGEREALELEPLLHCIEKDPALASRVLRAANSAASSPRQPVTTLRRAVVCLGARATRTLALTFSLSHAHRVKGFDYARYWRRALARAHAGRALAKLLPGVDSEEAFAAGLLRDVGYLALAEVGGEEYAYIAQQAEGEPTRLARYERAAFDSDHIEVGDWLLSRWGLPQRLVTCLRASYSDKPPADVLAWVVQLAAHVADVCMADDPRAAADRLAGLIHGRITRAVFDDVVAEAVAGVVSVSPLLDVDFDANDSAQIVSRALDALDREVLEHVRPKDAHGVAGLAGREEIEAALLELFDEGRGAPQLSVLFLAIDGFASLRSAHGGATGDGVVKAVGTVLVRELTVRSVGHYGGEEFLVVLPGYGLQRAADEADRLRAAVAGTRVPGIEGVRISVGVAAARAGFHAGPRDLITSARRALMTVKAGGGDHVRAADLGVVI